ncbi:hypothetical protein AX17_005313 [Amanita inopinata Kibby_2008]|nr:hypothetical protein AX17_005313 [Amanita inopinata Kibby_2008]
MSSAVGLPSYVAAPSLTRAPTYSAEPQEHEQRIALNDDRLRSRPLGSFVKETKSGGVRLVLSAQVDNAALPVYGLGGRVEGRLELSKTEGVTSVEVKVEGRLRLKEIAEGGASSIKLSLDTALLWIKDPHNSACPHSLNFCLNLPTKFTHDDKTYPLPPTFSVKLPGLPGFIATIDYTVSARINKPNAVPPLVPIVKSSLLGISIGTTTVTTAFLYYPRTRAASPLPAPLAITVGGFIEKPGWSVHESVISSKTADLQDIRTKLYLPASRTFCITQPIPFYLALEASVESLTAFLPYSPAPHSIYNKRATRIQLVRQSTIDVRNAFMSTAKTDMWRVDSIGEGLFRLAADAPSTILFLGEMKISEDVKVTAFRAAGLSVKDCILLTMDPPDPYRSPFDHLRQVIPVRLTTDPWTTDGTGIGSAQVTG